MASLIGTTLLMTNFTYAKPTESNCSKFPKLTAIHHLCKARLMCGEGRGSQDWVVCYSVCCVKQGSNI